MVDPLARGGRSCLAPRDTVDAEAVRRDSLDVVRAARSRYRPCSDGVEEDRVAAGLAVRTVPGPASGSTTNVARRRSDRPRRA